jgi:hypothetical protein
MLTEAIAAEFLFSNITISYAAVFYNKYRRNLELPEGYFLYHKVKAIHDIKFEIDGY